MRRVPREWLKHRFFDPRGVLIDLDRTAKLYLDAGVDPERLSLRTHALRPYHESRQAAIFCYGMGVAVLQTKVDIAPVEAEDFDCIAHYAQGGQDVFVQVQVKEFVPAEVNPNVTIIEELEKLKKYRSPGLVVAIHINRAGLLELSSLAVPKLEIGELWFFGAVSPYRDQWMLFGNMLENPRQHSFEYPRA